MNRQIQWTSLPPGVRSYLRAPDFEAKSKILAGLDAKSRAVVDRIDDGAVTVLGALAADLREELAAKSADEAADDDRHAKEIRKKRDGDREIVGSDEAVKTCESCGLRNRGSRNECRGCKEPLPNDDDDPDDDDPDDEAKAIRTGIDGLGNAMAARFGGAPGEYVTSRKTR